MKVGIDVGKGFVKVHDGEHCFRYPSFFSINDGFSVAQSDSVTIMNLNGHTYLLANNGSRPLSGDIMQPRDDSKTNGIQMLLHVLNVVATIHERRFGKGKEETRIEATVSVGLPISSFDAEKERLRTSLSGEHRFERNGRPFKVTLYPKACREGLGAYLSMILNEKGQTVNRSLFDSSIAIVDIGHRTTDVFMVQSGQANRQGCVGFMLGIFDIQGALESRISISYGTLALADRIKIFDWLSGGPVPRIRRNLLDETELKIHRDIAMKELITNLRENVLGCITPLGVDELYLTGGGAALLYPMIQAMDPTVRFCENPQFSNVIGFYRTLMV